MYVDCGICGTVRRENVVECTFCILKAEHVLIRKEIERISEDLDEMKKNERSESLKLEVGRLSKWVSELRREGSVRKKVVISDSVETKGSCRQEVDRGQANGRAMGVSRPSDSPRQEFERGRAIEADRTADRWCVVENRSNKIRIMRDTRPVTYRNRFSCLSDGIFVSNGPIPTKEYWETRLQIKLLNWLTPIVTWMIFLLRVKNITQKLNICGTPTRGMNSIHSYKLTVWVCYTL
ncbi:UNVERIFIED_CONTAM: hypothetical protein RMT77_011611 [Armadillidium vulgare]